MNTQSRKPQTLIAIVTQQRSGSKWIGSLIRQRYGTISLGEIFSPEDTSMMSFRSYLSKYSVDDLLGSDIFLILNKYFDDIRTYLGLFYSFDVMFNQLDWLNFSWRDMNKTLYGYFRSQNDIVVSLIRDPRDIFISMKALELTNKAHYTEFDTVNFNLEKLSNNNIKLEYDEYIRFRSRLLADRLALSSAFEGYDGYIELNYEDVLQDPSTSLNHLDHALRRFGKSIGHSFSNGVSPFPSLFRTPIDYREIFENIDEVFSWPY